MKELQKVLFIDLDGTIITTRSGKKFPIHSEDWKFIPETLNAMLAYANKGYKIIIVTNQGGIESGFTTETVFMLKIEKICKSLEKVLNLKKNSICYYFCPSMEGYSRKPNPGMAFDAAIDYDLTFVDSVMIGDMDSDREFSRNAGISNYYSIEAILDFPV